MDVLLVLCESIPLKLKQLGILHVLFHEWFDHLFLLHFQHAAQLLYLLLVFCRFRFEISFELSVLLFQTLVVNL